MADEQSVEVLGNCVRGLGGLVLTEGAVPFTLPLVVADRHEIKLPGLQVHGFTPPAVVSQDAHTAPPWQVRHRSGPIQCAR